MVKQDMHLYLNAGYLITVNDNFVLKPSFLLRGVKGIPLNYDINANKYSNNNKMSNFSIARLLIVFTLSLFFVLFVAVTVILIIHVYKIDFISKKSESYNKSSAFEISNKDNNVSKDFNNRSIGLFDFDLISYSSRVYSVPTNATFGSNFESRFNEKQTNNRQCGIRAMYANNKRIKRIINSKNANEHYGWVVSIRFIFKDKKLKYVCFLIYFPICYKLRIIDRF
jgi:hypothetical protein